MSRQCLSFNGKPLAYLSPTQCLQPKITTSCKYEKLNIESGAALPLRLGKQLALDVCPDVPMKFGSL